MNKTLQLNGLPQFVTHDPINKRILVTVGREYAINVFDCRDLSLVCKFGPQGTGPGKFACPGGIKIQPNTQNIIVADGHNNRVQILKDDGEYMAMIGTQDKPDMFDCPHGICCKPNGDICATEWNNNRVQLFDAGGRYLGKFGVWGFSKNSFRAPSDISVLDRRFSCSASASSVLLVADSWNERVCIWSMDGSTAISNFKLAGMTGGICVDLGGYVYASSKHEVCVFDPRNGFKQCLTDNLKFPDKLPKGISVDDENSLIVTDSVDYQVHVISHVKFNSPR